MRACRHGEGHSSAAVAWHGRDGDGLSLAWQSSSGLLGMMEPCLGLWAGVESCISGARRASCSCHDRRVLHGGPALPPPKLASHARIMRCAAATDMRSCCEQREGGKQGGAGCGWHLRGSGSGNGGLAVFVHLAGRQALAARVGDLECAGGRVSLPGMSSTNSSNNGAKR